MIMMNVSNSKCIRRLGLRSMKAAKTRNIVAVLAIALTTILFSSLFTIAASINYSLQQENFRQAGGDAHGSFKDITWEQVEQLRDDPLIRDSWARLFIGMPSAPPFNKSHVEVSYLETNGAPHYFCSPTEGALPREGTGEAATDTRVLALLGVEPEVGAKFTLPIVIDDNTRNPQTVERTFTLSGWWEYDSAVVSSNVLIPRSAAEEITALSNGEKDSMTGQWNLDVMFKNAINIEKNLVTVLANHNYQNTDAGSENYILIGVNWGYTGERVSREVDPVTTIGIVTMLLLIIFTGYLIIYNVFQISITNDIRFYGMLKTIGTTGKQLKRIIRQQAMLLSLFGIPLGLIFGFIIGNKLTPVIMAQLSYQKAFVSFNPWIFIGATAFSLLTVFLSCARPGRVVAKVSPVEAVRYTEGGQRSRKKNRKRAVKTGTGGASLLKMAWANLGRSKSKTVVMVISLTLAVVLMDLVFTFANGFDMEKYLQGNVVTDFIVGHANQFVAGSGGFRSAEQAVPEQIIADIHAQGNITVSGRVYGQERGVQQFVPEDFFRRSYSSLFDEESINERIGKTEHTENGMLAGDAQLYGMEDFLLSKLNVLEGDISPLSDPTQNAIAMVYRTDDYHEIKWDSNWGKIDDSVTLRYVNEWMYIDTDTGEEISVDEMEARYSRGETNFTSRAKDFVEKTYTVCALVKIPTALSYRYTTLGSSELILGAERFLQDTDMSSVMIYAFDTTTETNRAMDTFLSDYTGSVQPLYDYESKQDIVEQFDGFRTMFLTMGGALSSIIGLVGVLNFINTVLTGILTRKREFAVLQSIGMTDKQLKAMLVLEGVYYTMLSAALSLLLSIVLGPLVRAVFSVFWFFTYQFTILPVLVIIPLFLILGIVVPLLTYRSVARRTIVERLREAEN